MQSAFAFDAARACNATARAGRYAGVAVALALHAAALALLLSYTPARTALVNAVPLMVSLITPPAPDAQTRPKSLPMRPVPSQPPRALTPPTVLAAKPDARATESVAPPPAPAPPAPVEATPPPATATTVPAASPQTPLVPPAPQPVVAPNFDAAYLNNPLPVYPRLARRQGHHGKVVLRVFVSAGGSAEAVQLHTSCGHEELDQAAMAAVRRWRFVPARQGDQPVAAWVLVPITFTLEN